jgi:hypothetical protein
MKKTLTSIFGLLILFFVGFSQNSDIKITEIMYNAPNYNGIDGAGFDFVELKNVGSGIEPIGGYTFTDGIVYSFPGGTNLAGGEIVVLVADSTNFKLKYPTVSFFGQYTDTLSNKGERIQLASPFPVDTFLSITYNDDFPWPILADGNGWSIVPVETNPTTNQKQGEEWRASADTGGSPGVDDGTPPTFPEIIITECLTHTDPPEYDAVEIYNASSGAVDISGWFISDNRNNPANFIIPDGTIMNAGDYLVYDELDFNLDTTGFVFNRTGDHVILFSADADTNLTGYATGYDFGAQYNGVSFGRWITSEGDVHFVAQPTTTLGIVNDSPKVGPVVITHINYKPLQGAPPAPTHEEYLVLQNITSSVVNLYYEHWDATILDTTWVVKGVGFSFPLGLSLSPKEYVILTDTTPSYFRSQNVIPSFTKVYQYPGSLSNGKDNIRVMGPERKDTLPTGAIYTPYVMIDQVNYIDTVPWPIGPDAGTGIRLDRIVDNHYGNDPANWSESDAGTFDFLPLSITEMENAVYVSVFPNPAQHELNFVGEHKIEFINLYAVDGRLVKSHKQALEFIKLSVAELKSGVYFYEVNTNDKIVKGKVIIQ